MKTTIIALFSLLMVSFSVKGQEKELSEFLRRQASLTEENKAFLRENSFVTKFYLISDYSEPNGKLLDTDTPEIKTYRGTVSCNIEEDGRSSEKRMIFSMYFNKQKNAWMVADFRTYADPEYEFQVAKKDIDKGKFYTIKAYVYRNAAYWALNSGHIQDSKKYVNLAKEEAKKENIDDLILPSDKVLRAIL